MITKQARQRIEEETRKRIEERRKFITEKCGEPKDLNGLSDGNITILKILILTLLIVLNLILILWFSLLTDQLKAVCTDYHERIKKLESEKYDLEKEASLQTNEVNRIVQFQSEYIKSKFFSFSLTRPTLKWIIYVENCKISGFIVTKVCLYARKKLLAYISNT